MSYFKSLIIENDGKVKLELANNTEKELVLNNIRVVALNDDLSFKWKEAKKINTTIKSNETKTIEFKIDFEITKNMQFYNLTE